MKNKAKFERLKEIWNKKLEKNGFGDIESRNGDLKNRRFVLDSRSRGFDHLVDLHYAELPVYITEARTEYYRWAVRMVREGEFKSPRDKIIWELHSEGTPHPVISLKVKLERSWVSRRIRLMEKGFKTRK